MPYSQYIKDRIINRYSNPFYTKTPWNERGLMAIDTLKKKFPLSENIDYTFYQPRKIQHYLTIEKHFQGKLEGKVLDVGSRNNTIQDILKKPCTLVDKNNPNLPPFDWEKEQLPYRDGAFDTVVCLDTLEHISDLHTAFQDLLRVSDSYVIISLPNCWRKMSKRFVFGWGGTPSYGIPPERPHDRHKWFINVEDMENFVYYQSEAGAVPYEVVGVTYHMSQTLWRHKIIYPLFKFLAPEAWFKNIFVETTFMCLKKKK